VISRCAFSGRFSKSISIPTISTMLLAFNNLEWWRCFPSPPNSAPRATFLRATNPRCQHVLMVHNLLELLDTLGSPKPRYGGATVPFARRRVRLSYGSSCLRAQYSGLTNPETMSGTLASRHIVHTRHARPTISEPKIALSRS